jgi:tetratricopeptide (TPR) repeat protein/glycosyltransferase involved in cell wall biosynthesis
MNRTTLIALATGWGPKHGGINSFNYDFLRGFGGAFGKHVQIFCVVPVAETKDYKEAQDSLVQLITFISSPSGEKLEQSHSAEIISLLEGKNIDYNQTVWLGHDLFTGAAAVAGAQKTNSRSAVIHHMSYAAYESYKSGSAAKAQAKTKEQKAIFQAANIRLAVGPLLRDALDDWFGSGSTQMLIPGLPNIDPKPLSNKLTAVLFGRLNPETDRIKQTKLGVAAVAQAYKQAVNDSGAPAMLRDNRPRIKLFGVAEDGEGELRLFAEQQAGAVLELHPLPYSENRLEIFDELSSASIALMPSWHEGFGLVGWEAIAAGVPLILGKESGLMQLLQETLHGASEGCVKIVNVGGSEIDPYFQSDDLLAMTNAVREIAAKPQHAKNSALWLREHLLAKFTPKQCAKDFVKALSWKNLLTAPISEIPQTLQLPAAIAPETDNDFIAIPTPGWELGLGYAESQLLRAEEACVDFHPAREEKVTKLMSWANDEKGFPIAVQLHIGAGGIGKTRLLLETCQRLNKTGQWQAGFLNANADAAEIKQRIAEFLSQNKALFIAIDYAETHRDQLVAVLETAQKYGSCRVRVALIARSSGDWFERLAIDYPSCEKIFAGSACSGPYPLPALHQELADREQAYTAALSAYAQRLGFSDFNRQSTLTPNLAAEHFANPLYLQMAALLALHGEHADTANGLTDALLRHEDRYWQRLAHQLDLSEGERTISHLLTLSTLCGELSTEKEAWEAYELSGGSMLTKADCNRLFRALCPLYPGRQGLQPLRPDLLGEALIARSLTTANDSGEAQLNFALGKTAGDLRRCHALTILTRAAVRRPELQSQLTDCLRQHFASLVTAIIKVGQETGEPLAEAACSAFEQLQPAIKQQVVGMLLPSLPAESVHLAKLALYVTQAKAESTKIQKEKHPQDLRKIKAYAGALINLSIRTAEMGQDELALEYAQEAYALFRSLDAKQPKQYAENYAHSLNNLGNRLRAMGRYEEAEEHRRQALIICENLTIKNTDSSALNHAVTLNNMGNILSCLGRYEEAFKYGQEALAIYQRLAIKKPELYEPGYAGALRNSAFNFYNLGRFEEALAHSQQAVKIYCRLNETSPDRYEPDYADALINLAVDLSNRRHYAEAFQHSQHSLQIYQRLAEIRPDRFELNYAHTLNNFSSDLFNQGRYQEAFDHIQQAVSIYQRLSVSRPEQFEPDYARALDNLAEYHASLDCLEMAISSQAEALTIYQRHAEKRPKVYAENYLSIAINHAYWQWLARQTPDWEKLVQLEQLYLPQVQTHRQPLITSQMAFVAGCIAYRSAPDSTQTYFEQLIASYQPLPLAMQQALQAPHLLAAIYLAQHHPTPIREQAAQSTLQTYAKQRENRLAFYITETLKRLDCKHEL